jgi:integrase
MPFLHRRECTWYFRFKLPERLKALAGRYELRISLGTRELAVARQRAEQVLSDVYCLKQLARHMSGLDPSHVQRALDIAFSEIVEKLERSKEPWLRGRVSAWVNGSTGFGFQPNGSSAVPAGFGLLDIQLFGLRRAIEANDPARGRESARALLKRIDAPVEEESPIFQRLALELMKLEAMHLEAQKARADGDFRKEEEFIEYYRRRGYRSELQVAAPVGPRLSEAWQEYAREKRSALPKPQWSDKTADFQESTFEEFLEIVSDRRLSEIDRETIIRYAQTIQKLPKNRKKIHGETPIVEVLKLNIPEKNRASERTLAEKLIRVKAFLDWCRVTKGLPKTDPTERISFKAESQSYAPFTQEDLQALFGSKDYIDKRHTATWRFWVPLLALYTGARQAELAQLTLKDIGEEGGVSYLSITNFGEGQQVKTKAGIRKVPISSRLKKLGFLDYVEALRTRGDRNLFPDLRRRNGKADSSAISRWFNEQYLEACGVQRQEASGRRKVFHSFRHTAITKALSAGQSMLAHCQQVFGHEKSLLGETATYMGVFPIETLVPVVEALDYGIDHRGYQEAWRSLANW